MQNRKKITEIGNHEEIVSAIQKNNINKLLHYLHDSSDLNAVDANGKSLLELIQASDIDINKKRPIEYLVGTYNLTPLEEFFFKYPPEQTGAPFDQLRLRLALGANVNQVIDSNGNTILHRYIKHPNAHPFILRDLLTAGGDYFKKNNQGDAPINLAAEHVATFINQSIATQGKTQQSAIKMQRKWRLHLQKKLELEKKSESKSSAKPSVKLIHRLLSDKATAPASNPPNKKKMQAWINKHDEKDQKTAAQVIAAVQHISHKHFLFGLKMAIEKFNRYLLSLPKENRNYIILVNPDADKSDRWVVRLAVENYLCLPPSEIITTDKMLTLDPNNNYHHMVYLDDASYSGNALKGFLNDIRDNILPLNNRLMNLQLHFIIPFMTRASRLRLQAFNDVMIHTQETIPSFNIPGTKFTGCTATYFDHKVPEPEISTIGCIHNGNLINGTESGIQFVKPVIPPYKPQQFAIKIQRKWRLHFQKKLESKSGTKPSVKLIHRLLSDKAKTPAPNPPNKEKMQAWINKHDEKDQKTAAQVIAAVQHISHDHFLFGLRMAIKKFNQYLLSRPEANRNYIILVNSDVDKSDRWVVKLAENLCLPPSEIITTEEMLTLEPNKNYRHMVHLDDASYSGNALINFLNDIRGNTMLLKNRLMNLQLHFIIPFMTEPSRSRLQSFNDVMIHTQETIPSFNIPGTKFAGCTATYFDHKIPEPEVSTIDCIHNGNLINGKESGIQFVKPVIPPYKKIK